MALQSLQTWLNSAYAGQFFHAQSVHLDQALRACASPTTLVIGRIGEYSIIDGLKLPYVCRMSVDATRIESGLVDVVADNAFLPFPEKTFSTVVLLHSMESSELPHQTLREAHRVLQSDGHLVIAGFNPYSLLGLQSLLRRPAMPEGQAYGLKRVYDWLSLLDFEVTGSAMFQYGPLTSNARLKRYFSVLENIGDRWFPMFGGAYMLLARKREIGATLIGLKKRKIRGRQRHAVPIKSALKKTSSR